MSGHIGKAVFERANKYRNECRSKDLLQIGMAYRWCARLETERWRFESFYHSPTVVALFFQIK